MFFYSENLQIVINALNSLDVCIIIYCLKAQLKKWVLNFFLKSLVDVDVFTWLGKSFQSI